MTGSHRFVIELYDTNTEHDVIISYEMVATGHAQTSPERTKVCLGFNTESACVIRDLYSVLLMIT